MTSALPLLLEALTLLILGLDLRQGFATLGLPGRSVLVLAAGCGGALLLWPGSRRRIDPRLRGALAALAVGGILLGGAGLFEARAAARLAAGWDAGARARLESRAATLEQDFRWFLHEAARPLESSRVPLPDRGDAFQALDRARASSRLPADRLGFAVYRPGRELWAWQGNATQAPADLLASAGASPRFRAGGAEGSPRLYVALAGGQGLTWVSEFVLGLPPVPAAGSDEAGDRFDFLPHWSDVLPAYLQIGSERAGDDDLSLFLESQGDRYWRHLGAQGGLMLSFPLKAPDGTTLAVASLKDRRPAQQIAALRRGAKRAGALVLVAALGAVWILLLSGGALPALRSRLLVGALMIVAIRLALLGGTEAGRPGLRIYDFTIYASSSFGGLARSPADFLLTAVACLALVGLGRHGLLHWSGPRRPAAGGWIRRLALLGAALGAVGGPIALHHFLDGMVLDARTDVSRVELDSHTPARLALQASLLILVFAFAMLVLLMIDLALRCRRDSGGWTFLRRLREGSPGRFPAPHRFTLAVLVLTLLYVPFLQHAYERLRQDFFENDLVPRVRDQEERRADYLRRSVALAEEPEFAAGAQFAVDDALTGSGSAACRLWATTPMAAMGLASGLEIYNEEGRLLSRFAVNLAPMLAIPFAEAREAAGGPGVRVAPRPRQPVRKSVIFGSRWVRAARRPPLLVVMTVVDDYDNLPFLSSENARVSLFRSRAVPRTNPELLRFDPVVAVFGPNLERLYSSSGEIPPPDPQEMQEIGRRGMVWTTDDLGDGPARVVYFKGPREIFALAQPAAGLVGRVASFLRLFLLNALLGAFGAGLAWAAGRARRGRARRPPAGTTFYGRVTAAFLVTALVPLLALAYFVTRSTRREFDHDITTSGLASLQVARRVAEDYLTVSGQEEPPTLDDDVVFWLSRVVRQDLDVYKDADLLATSNRELYTSGLMNGRLDGEAYRSLYLDREPFRLVEARIGGVDYLELSAPMTIDRAGTIGVIAIPLSSQRRAAARKAEEVEGVILISTCLTVLLLAGVGWRVARRVSEPIALLAGAARSLERGDLETRVSAKAGREIDFLVDSFNRMAGSLRDQREILRRRKDYIEKILARATTGVVSIDAAGSIITINPAAESLLAARGPAPRVGEDLPARLLREPSLEPLRRALQQALAADVDREVELAVPPPSDGERRLRAVFLPFVAEDGAPPGRIILLEDVTGIVRSGRLAAWAEMARRIAHEVKNPLTPIQLSVEHVRRVWRARDARFGEVLDECLDNIERQVRVLRQIASESSSYARPPQLHMEPIAVEAILDDVLGPYAASPPPGVTVMREVAAGLPPVMADRAAIGRALVNLIENALQAMPGGGRLAVAAGPADGPAGPPRVRIEVRDTGTGMEPEVLRRIFEPYFSTKSGGTGLGLPIARQAVEEHGGAIEIRSRPGEGTRVSLVLPAAPPGAGAGAP